MLYNHFLSFIENKILEGADIIDIGAQSSRPFSSRVSAEQELERIGDAISLIASHFPQIPISVDTSSAEVARMSLESGANMINDISAARTRLMATVVVFGASPQQRCKTIDSVNCWPCF